MPVFAKNTKRIKPRIERLRKGTKKPDGPGKRKPSVRQRAEISEGSSDRRCPQPETEVIVPVATDGTATDIPGQSDAIVLRKPVDRNVFSD